LQGFFSFRDEKIYRQGAKEVNSLIRGLIFSRIFATEDAGENRIPAERTTFSLHKN